MLNKFQRNSFCGLEADTSEQDRYLDINAHSYKYQPSALPQK